MRTFRLTSAQRRRLRMVLRTARDAHVALRTVALLALDRGMRPAQVATSLGVTRQTVYNWADRFNAGGVRALVDRPRRGRPSKLPLPVRRFLAWSLQQQADELGYPSVSWTVPLLREHLGRWAGVRVSAVTVRRTLHHLGYVWKRPRYVLQPDPDRTRKKA